MKKITLVYNSISSLDEYCKIRNCSVMIDKKHNIKGINKFDYVMCYD